MARQRNISLKDLVWTFCLKFGVSFVGQASSSDNSDSFVYILILILASNIFALFSNMFYWPLYDLQSEWSDYRE